MGIEGLRSYLPRDQRKVSEATLLIEQANALESTAELLQSEFGVYIPSGGAGSIKMKCIWGVEHKDGGIERSMRYYYETDSAFCFRDHGVIDPVAIRSSVWNVSKTQAAKAMVNNHTVSNRPHWSQRMKEMLEAEEQQFASIPNAIQALNLKLNGIEGYSDNQYNPRVIALKLKIMEVFDPLWTLTEIEQWLDAASQTMEGIINAKERL